MRPLALLLLAATPALAQPTGQITGTAFLSRNHPVVGAVVRIDPVPTDGTIRLTTTDSRGAFRFADLADGTYRVEVRRAGLAPYVRDDVALKAPFRAVVEIQMKEGAEGGTPSATDPASGTLAGTVATSTGPIAEVRVRLVRNDGKTDPRLTLTDDAGGFSFADVAGGLWRLEILGPGYLPIRTDLEVAGEVRVAASIVAQPENYEPAPEDLMPLEEVAPPR